MRSGGADTNHLERADLFGLLSEGQPHHMAGLNLLASIVIYSNTAHLGEEVRQRKHAGLTVEPAPHPLGGPTSCSPANTGGQSQGSDLNVRFCPLPESTLACSSKVVLPAEPATPGR